MNGFPKIELNNPKNVEVTTQVQNSSKSFAWYKDPIILAGIMIIFSMIFAAFAFYQVATDKKAKYGLHETDNLPSLGGGNVRYPYMGGGDDYSMSSRRGSYAGSTASSALPPLVPEELL